MSETNSDVVQGGGGDGTPADPAASIPGRDPDREAALAILKGARAEPEEGGDGGEPANAKQPDAQEKPAEKPAEKPPENLPEEGTNKLIDTAANDKDSLRDAAPLRKARKAMEARFREQMKAIEEQKKAIEERSRELESRLSGSVAVRPDAPALEIIDQLAKSRGMSRTEFLRDANKDYIEDGKPEAAVARVEKRLADLETENKRLREEGEKAAKEREAAAAEDNFRRQLSAFIPAIRAEEFIAAHPELVAADDEDIERVVRWLRDEGALDRYVKQYGGPPPLSEWAQMIALDKRVRARHARFTAGRSSSETRPGTGAAKAAEPEKKPKTEEPARAQVNGSSRDPDDEARANALRILREASA